MKNKNNYIALALICLAVCVFSACLLFKPNDDNSEGELSGESETFEEETVTQESKGEETSAEGSKSEVSENESGTTHISVERLTLDRYSLTVAEGKTDMAWVTIYPENASDKSEIWSSSNPAVATVDGVGRVLGKSVGECVVTVYSADNRDCFAEIKVTVSAASPKIEPTYIGGILIVNKTYPLPSDYSPGVDREANEALQEMFAQARSEGLELRVVSGFRDYSLQKQFYDRYVARDGKEMADTYSARPGHSEHQTGLAFDINDASRSFEGTPEAIWLAENCYKFGFIIRYPKGKEEITGYIYEPWHIRYLGIEKATEVFESGLTLEEFLGITSVYAD